MNLHGDLVDLFTEIVDIESVSGNEKPLADSIQFALEPLAHLSVERFEDTVLARTELGRAERVVVAGHLDTVPVKGNLPHRREGDRIYGRGTCDMKGGVAVALQAAAQLTSPSRDVTWIFYDHEEVDAALNSLSHIDPAKLAGDLAILMEPTAALIEGGCQGHLRFQITTKGIAAHSARSWRGHNAIHDMFDVLARLYRYQPREVEVEGLTYREGLNAVRIWGGIASNVIPDACTIEINHRFAPDHLLPEAQDYCRELFIGYDLDFVDGANGARPGLDTKIAQEFVSAVGGTPRPKFGWTDVARFSALGIPAINFGPGDPFKAHADDEYCDISDLHTCHQALLNFLQ
ncbi:MAG: succinyl-diaminopimelate desuccinylase [Propionibacteriaceae bacterium]|nr:succinyl-diaminopimelate desuccinylase [Propionibacteriaceae bacterium]